MRGALTIAALLVAACSQSDAVLCGPITCPPDTTCGPGNLCIPVGCGDSMVTGIEGCDGTVADLECADFGYTAGPPLTCSPVCQIDTSQCFDSCGDHTVDGAELCDGIPPAGFGCADFGFDVGPLACTSACSPAFTLCGAIGWQPAPGGATNELRALWASGPKAGVAVGLAGTILRATDGVWNPMTPPPAAATADLFGVTGLANGVIAVGAGGTILRFDGTTWRSMASPTTKNLRAIAATGPQTAVAVGAEGVTLRFDGTTWTVAAPPNASTPTLTAVWANATSAYAVGDAGTVLRAQGTTWVPIAGTGIPADMDLFSVFVTGNDQIFIGGEDGAVFARISGVWQAFDLSPSLAIPTAADVYSIWASSPSDVFLGFEGGAIAHFDGIAPTLQTSSTSRSIFALFGLGPTRVLGATRGGSILEYNGTDRRVETVTGPVGAFAALYRHASTYYAANKAGIVSRHSGGTWTTQAVSGTPALTSIWSDGTDIWVGGIVDVYRSAAGAAFTSIGTPVGATGAVGANAIAGTTSPSLHIVAVGDRVIESTNGTNWTVDASAPNTSTLHDLWRSSDGVWFAVGDLGFAMRRAGNTGTWQVLPTGTTEHLDAVWGTSANDVFVVGSHGLVLHWNGLAWRRLYTGSGENLTSIHGTSRGDIYVGGTNGALLHYDGTSWSRMTTGIEINAVWSTPSATLFAGAQSQVEWLFRAIVPTEERCIDPWDDDGNDGTNCEDVDCRNNLTCLRGGVCETRSEVDCATLELAASTYTGIARIDDLPCLDHSTPGPEASYRFLATQTGRVTVAITEIETTGILDLVVIEGAFGACQLETCVAATRNASTQSVTFDATADRIYYVLVDGPVYTAAPFTLNVSCP